MHLVLAYCGGTLPALAGRLQTLGFEAWVANPNEITREEMQTVFRKLLLDTAAVCPHALALEMTTHHQIVYGSACGVACSTKETMNANIQALLSCRGLSAEQNQEIGRHALTLFLTSAARLKSGSRALRETAVVMGQTS
jgi:6-methylsalicylate decarboxylase